MAIETKHKEIGGVTFGVTPLPGKRALLMQPRLARILAPAIAQAGEDVGKALDSLFSRLTPDEYLALTQELLYNATADSTPLFGPGGCFDSLFTGRSEMVPQLLQFAISEVNFAGFFDKFGDALRRLAAPTPTPAPKEKAAP